MSEPARPTGSDDHRSDRAGGSATPAAVPFWPEFRRIAVPVTAQSVVMSSVLVADQLMVGRLGPSAVASVGISLKITAILTVAVTGLATGVSIFAAQYWGRQERARIRQLLGLGLGLGFPFSALISAFVVAFPALCMSPFTTDPEVLATGSGFVRIIALSYLPTMLTLIYSAVLRSTGMPRLPLWASVTAAVLNLALDWLLIFGNLGAPRLGLEGAALSTTIARVVEIVVILIGVYATRHASAVTGLADLRGSTGRDLRGFLVVALPLAVNELLWILGESLYVVVYGRMGTQALTAMSMTFPLQSLAIGVMTGIAGATSVLVGQRLGRDDREDAARRSRQLIAIGVGAAVVTGGLLVLLAPWYVDLYAVPDATQHLGRACVVVFAAYLWVKTANMILAGAVLNAGGDTRFVLIMETLATWCIGVPVAFAAAFALNLPVWAVFALLSIEEVVRLAAGWVRLRSGKWMRTLVPNAVSSPT